jgi:hypothetical protein
VTDVDEHDIEQALRRVQPCGPSSDLRNAVRTVRTPGAWPWGAAAAALLAAVVLLRVGMAQQIDQFTPDQPDADAQGMVMLTEALGGDAEARRIAEILVLQDAIRQANAAAAGEGTR